jgi:prepilin-type N-terminal cleavage/methylation domain-containing protein/prepilin-type processing-associated H-X9-DG protein
MLHRVLRPRRNHPSATPPASRGRRAFTLAELLIVIAIIGVLISILLPTLSSARRSANAAKCLAQLRDLGLAFQQYAQDNKRAFPVVEYSPPASYVVPGTPARRSWQDFLVKYLHKRDPDGNLIQFRNASPLWGCPNYESDIWWKDVDPPTTIVATGANKFNTGYGMQRYALAPYRQTMPIPAPPDAPMNPSQLNGTAGIPGTGNTAIVRDSAGLEGSFFKMEKWAVRAAERGLVSDCNNFDIIASTTWSKSAPVGPGGTERRCEPFMWNTANNGITGSSYINVDGARHMSAGSNIKKVFGTKGVNMLFVDGHAAGVTPEEAWIAIRGAGMDVRGQ